MCIEWSPRDVNSTTIWANGSWSHGEEQYTLHRHKRQRTTSSGLVSSLKSNRNLFSRLFVASQFRDGNLNDYFSHKYQPCPPSLSARGKLKLGTKSDIVRCLEDVPEKQDDITPSVDVVMLETVRRTSHAVRTEACSLRNFAARICMPRMCSCPMWNINWVKYTALTSCGTNTDQIL